MPGQQPEFQSASGLAPVYTSAESTLTASHRSDKPSAIADDKPKNAWAGFESTSNERWIAIELPAEATPGAVAVTTKP